MEVGPNTQSYLDFSSKTLRGEALAEILRLSQRALEEEQTASVYIDRLQRIKAIAEDAIAEVTIDEMQDIVFALTYAGNCAARLTKENASYYGDDMESLKKAIETLGGSVGNNRGIFLHCKLPCFAAAVDVLLQATSGTCACLAIWAADPDNFVGATQGGLMLSDPRDSELHEVLLQNLDMFAK